MELLKELTQINSPSGREDKIREFILNQIKDDNYDTSTDTLGNIIVHKKGNGKKIMIAAHMDEIGIIVSFIDKNGFIRFSSLGGLEVKELPRRKVVFENGTIGVIGTDKAFVDKTELSNLYVDIGAKDKNEAEKIVNVGDTAVFVGEYFENDNIIVSKAVDNRVGCFILLDIIKNNIITENDLYFVFTAQEEVGLRGAKTSAYSILPDLAFSVDVTDTGDFPDSPEMDVKLGGGAAIKAMDRSIVCDKEVFKTLVDIAEKEKIMYQTEIMSDGGTDAGAISLTASGVKTGGISIPVRYIHSPSEMADKNDIDCCIKLLKGVCTYNW